MSAEKWKTSITDVQPNKISVRGYPIDDLMGKISFSRVVYLVLMGELPDEKTGKMLEAILVSSIDHGVTPPSTLTALNVASTGADFTAALASGILSISKFHGGAIESAMEIFYSIENDVSENKLTIEKAVKSKIDDLRSQKKVVSGFGHRLHTSDPRTVKLFDIAEENNIADKFIEIANAVGTTLSEVTGKDLPINVDGAIGAILCELGIPSYMGNLFFILSRVSLIL